MDSVVVFGVGERMRALLFDSISSKKTSVPSSSTHRNPPPFDTSFKRFSIDSLSAHNALDLSISDTVASLMTPSWKAS